MTKSIRTQIEHRRYDLRAGGAEERGQALVVALILVAVVALLTLVALGDSVFATSSTTRAATTTEGSTSASAGISAALYDISEGHYFCKIKTTKLTSGAAGTTNQYSVKIIYFQSYTKTNPEPTPTTSNTVQCTQPTSTTHAPATALTACTTPTSPRTPESASKALPDGVTFGAALLCATGRSSAGPRTSIATIRELVRTYPLNPGYVLYSHSSTGLDLSRVRMLNSTTTNDGTATGTIYSSSSIFVTGPNASKQIRGEHPHTDTCLLGTLTARTRIVMKKTCLIGSSVSLFTTKITNSVVIGTSSTANGNISLANSWLMGNASAAGSLNLCPVTVARNPTCATLVTGTGNTTKMGGAFAGKTTIDKVTVHAADTVFVGTNKYVAAPSQAQFCTLSGTTGKIVVTGCAYPTSTGFSVSPPKNVAFPTVVAPVGSSSTRAQAIAVSLWTKAGYAIKQTSTCGSGTTSVVADMNSATKNTVVVATCPVVFSGVTVTMNHNVALFAPTGITIRTGVHFNPGTRSTAQLFLMVPTPSSGSCSTSNNITITAASASTAMFSSTGQSPPNKTTFKTWALSTFLFTPCQLSIGGKAKPNITGAVVVGSLTIGPTALVTLRHSQFVPTDFSYGYQPLAVTRYIASG
jgi:Tfp pilus assembly protein PilX